MSVMSFPFQLQKMTKLAIRPNHSHRHVAFDMYGSRKFLLAWSFSTVVAWLSSRTGCPWVSTLSETVMTVSHLWLLNGKTLIWARASEPTPPPGSWDPSLMLVGYFSPRAVSWSKPDVKTRRLNGFVLFCSTSGESLLKMSSPPSKHRKPRIGIWTGTETFTRTTTAGSSSRAAKKQTTSTRL